MKQLKKLAALCLAITCAFGVAITATACNGGTESSASSSTAEQTDAYVFYVKNADGTPAGTNIFLQVCIGGLEGTCFPIGNLDENGRIASSQKKGAPLEAGVYDIHLLRDGEELAFDGPTTTSANFEAITLTLKD